jgi:GNAT superfamily N-acetyltransferase
MMHVRFAEPRDAEEIERIRVRGWQAAYRHVFPPAKLDALPVDSSRWRDRLLNPEPGFEVLLATDADQVVAFASLYAYEDEPKTALIGAFYVDPPHWRRGFGDALLRQAEDRLAERYVAAILWVLEDNERARQFYERAGWTADGATESNERLGVTARELRYRKRLRSSRSRG